eukprot:11219203-Lingulodinium_polyedra.AAC.1
MASSRAIALVCRPSRGQGATILEGQVPLATILLRGMAATAYLPVASSTGTDPRMVALEVGDR